MTARYVPGGGVLGRRVSPRSRRVPRARWGGVLLLPVSSGSVRAGQPGSGSRLRRIQQSVEAFPPGPAAFVVPRLAPPGGAGPPRGGPPPGPRGAGGGPAGGGGVGEARGGG